MRVTHPYDHLWHSIGVCAQLYEGSIDVRSSPTSNVIGPDLDLRVWCMWLVEGASTKVLTDTAELRPNVGCTAV